MLSVLLVVAGALGLNALLAPWGLPLALVVGAIGVWTIRNGSRSLEVVSMPRDPVSIG